MYGNNYRGDSGGDVMLPGYQDIPSNRCFNIVNVPGGVDIERDDDIIPYSHLCQELGALLSSIVSESERCHLQI